MGLLIQRVAEVSGYSPEQGLYDVAYPTGFLNFLSIVIGKLQIGSDIFRFHRFRKNRRIEFRFYSII